MLACAHDQPVERFLLLSDAEARIERRVGGLGPAGDKGHRARRSGAG